MKSQKNECTEEKITAKVEKKKEEILKKVEKKIIKVNK